MKFLKVTLPCLLMLFPAAAASACDGGNLAMAYLFGYNNFQFRTGVINNYTPPYFSMHPPVYYGERYYRPYGASPFAAWPQLQANPDYAPRAGVGIRSAAVIENPYCCGATPVLPQAQPAEVPDVVKNYSGPLVIENPYFIENESQLTSANLH